MWIDENGAAHTVWVPPESILGEEAVAALRAVPRLTADKVIRELDAIALSVEEAATAAAGRGPIDPDSADLDGLPSPPAFPGLALGAGEDHSATVLHFLSEVPAEWRYEAMEAMYDALEPPSVGEAE
jgi:hypothetical protein